jgi:hypothetical protein
MGYEYRVFIETSGGDTDAMHYSDEKLYEGAIFRVNKPGSEIQSPIMEALTRPAARSYLSGRRSASRRASSTASTRPTNWSSEAARERLSDVPAVESSAEAHVSRALRSHDAYASRLPKRCRHPLLGSGPASWLDRC